MKYLLFLVFMYPETTPLFVDNHKQRKSMVEKQQCSYKKLVEYIYGTYLNSEAVVNNRISGPGTLAFVITAEGKVRSPWVEGTINTAFANELIKLALQIPSWSDPAMVNGNPVAMEFKLPIKLTIDFEQ